MEQVLHELSAISEKLDSVENRLERLEQRPTPKPRNVCGNDDKPPRPPPPQVVFRQTSEEIISSNDGKGQKAGKFFDKQQCLFLTVQLEEIKLFVKSVPSVDKHLKKDQLKSLESVIDALTIKSEL
ncbi:unnamed protein product [Clavelina lepadiformis]|uniref:Uncharacterized protein n=1 Tax=Clavelina lepadiformis TaxID=159417 RepID=A0ABP0G7K7_CLALP